MAVEYLLKTPIGLATADPIERAVSIAPESLDAEVPSALRGAVLGGGLEEERARWQPSTTMCPHAVQSIFTGIAKSLEPVR